MWSSRVIGDRVHAHGGAVGSPNCPRDLLQPQILDLIWSYNSHGTTRNACLTLVIAHTHAMLVFHLPRPTSTRSFFSLVTRSLTFIVHGPRPRNAYPSQLTYMQCLFPEPFCWLYLRPDVSVNNIHRVHEKCGSHQGRKEKRKKNKQRKKKITNSVEKWKYTNHVTRNIFEWNDP